MDSSTKIYLTFLVALAVVLLGTLTWLTIDDEKRRKAAKKTSASP